ncbi:MAG TPA: response regulator transcription factor [Anaerolineales bacterium]|nr:response regulator transcription factor [Anaerolineales bacterium]
MPNRILVVDDEIRYLRLLEANLLPEGFEISTALNGEEALEKFSNEHFDLVLLDIMMPKMDGFTACQRIRQFSQVPIIMLTAKGSENDKVHGLDSGADDFLVKPFSINELLARVRAVLRRSQPVEGTQERMFTHGDLKIDQALAEVWLGEKQIFLSATEYRLLLQFSHNVGEIVSAEDLLSSVWGSEYFEDKEILWVTIARLRQKVEENPHEPRHIVTRPGLGYFMPSSVDLQIEDY